MGYKRLTTKTEYGYSMCDNCPQRGSEWCYLTDHEPCCGDNKAIDRLGVLEDKIESGVLVELTQFSIQRVFAKNSYMVVGCMGGGLRGAVLGEYTTHAAAVARLEELKGACKHD